MPLIDYVLARLERLCTAAQLGDERDAIVNTFGALWGDAVVPPGWISDISDDNTPIELSVAMEGERTEVRVLFEVQATEPTLAAYRRAGLAFHERLEREYGADLSRFRLLQDLFLPEGMEGPFAVWSSVVFARGKAPAFKTYFNPRARGGQNARRLVQTAFERLGMHDALSHLHDTALRRGELDELKYFALDLGADPRSRVKVYVRHHEATPADLEVAASAAASYVPNDTRSFVRAMAGGDAPLRVRAPFTCSAFTADESCRPASTTVYVPVCAYARDDAAVHDRIARYMRARGLDPAGYDALVEGFANRPLEAGIGMQAWFALRTHAGAARFTVYFATEATRVHAPGVVPAPTAALATERVA
jgi:DMATS type aromatic prenyltransferase